MRNLNVALHGTLLSMQLRHVVVSPIRPAHEYAAVDSGVGSARWGAWRGEVVPLCD